MTSTQPFKLPDDSRMWRPEFEFGVATSSYQIEGAVDEDGRTPSIWDEFCQQPGAILDSENGDIACDHYHRWQQDIDLIASLNVDCYRLSIAWPRIIPEPGVVNAKGLAFYERLIDALKARGIKVFVTLYHWDLPQYLEDQGGWLNRETAYRFAEYARVIAHHFGNKIDIYATLNEPMCSAWLGYRFGTHAPGKKGEQEGFLAAHHLLLAHGLAMPELRQWAPQARCGIVVNASPGFAASASQADQQAALDHDSEDHHWFIEPVLEGHYPASVLERYAAIMPDFASEDLKQIQQPIDFLGLNYYSRSLIRAEDGQPQKVTPAADVECTHIGWEIYPQGLTTLLTRLQQRYDLPPIYIAENGAASNDHLIAGAVDDPQRVRYFQQHLMAVDEAIRKGVEVKAYYAWSLMDNFEWAYGYQQRFGLVYVDYTNQQRILKTSGRCYQQMLAARAQR